jgi:hypothetical protein
MTPHVQTSDVDEVKKLQQAHDRLIAEIGKVIVGQKGIIAELLISLLARGHCLLVGVPGLAKTLLISTLARVLDLKFSRIQFTPDLMPSDITGTEIIEENTSTGHKAFKFVKGPVFANIVLADEINRTPPKTQAALLQAMQEHEVTAAGTTYHLEEPFFVLATQNPIEQEGTYPLPEAQLDRFMFNLWVDYPSKAEEVAIVNATTSAYILSGCSAWCVAYRSRRPWSTSLSTSCTVPDPSMTARLRSSGSGSAGAPVPGLLSISFWLPRPVLLWKDGQRPKSQTFVPWQSPCCVTGW